MGKWATYRHRGGGGSAGLLPGPGADDWTFTLAEDTPPPNFGGIGAFVGSAPGGITDWIMRSRTVGDVAWVADGQANLGDTILSNLATIGIDAGIEAQAALVDTDGNQVSQWSETKTVASP